MIITCEACGTSYKIKASLISENGSPVKCSRCQHIFVAYPPSAETEKPAEDGPASRAHAADEAQTGTPTFFEDAAETEKQLDDLFSDELTSSLEEEDAPEETTGPEAGEETFDLPDPDFGQEEKQDASQAFGTDAPEEEEEVDLADLQPEATVELDELEYDDADLDLSDLESEPVDLAGLTSEPAELAAEEVARTDLETNAEPFEETVQETFDLNLETTRTRMDTESAEEPGLTETAAGVHTEFPELGAEAGTETGTLQERSEEISLAELESQTEEVDLADLQPEATVELGELEYDDADMDLAELESEPVDLAELSSAAAGAAEETAAPADADIEAAADRSEEEEEEIFDLDLDLTDEDQEAEAGEEAEEDFDLDLDLDEIDLFDWGEEIETAEAGEEPAEAGEFGESDSEAEIDLDADFLGLEEEEEAEVEPEAPAGRSPEAFEMDLADKEAAAEAEDFDLDLEKEAPAPGAGDETGVTDKAPEPEESETEAGAEDEEESFELDLDLEDAAEATGAEAGAEEEEIELELDFEEPGEDAPAAEAPETREPKAETPEAGADQGESTGFDLGLGEKSGSDEGAEDAFEFDLGLEEESQPEVEAEAGEDRLDLELDLGEEEPGRSGPEEEDFELELDFESPEAEEERAVEEPGDTGADELDLTDVEEFLEKTEEAEDEGATGEFDLDLETAPASGQTSPEEADDFDVDLSTMLDETFEGTSGGKEVSLEAVEETEPAAAQAGEQQQAGLPASGEAGGEASDADWAEPEETAPAKGKKASRPPVPGAKRKPVKRIFLALLILILLGAAGGGALYYMDYPGVRGYVDSLGITEFLGLKAASVEDPGSLRIAVTSPEYRIVENQQAGRLLVVTGSATNQYDHARSHILVRANLFDSSGNRIKRAAAFCGNIIDGNQLKNMDMEGINQQLSRKQGAGGVNADVAPGRSIPYMVVLSDLPENIASLTVEVLSSDRAQ